jgi:transcriptional regulator with PAS, ATPase and Fis domain
MIGKSSMMKLLEVTHGMSIEDILIDAYNNHPDQKSAAKSLGISRQSLYLWCRQLGLKYRRILIKKE